MKTLRVLTALLALATFGSTHAQGIPVIDIANLVQSIQQVVDDVTKIENQVQQIDSLQRQLGAMTGSRGLGTILNDPALQSYVSPNATELLQSVQSSGYAGLTGTGRSLRDASMLYNCLDRTGAARTSCQAGLAQPYQQEGLLQDAMRKASGRLAQISALMAQISAAPDQKAALEIQSRLTAEGAMLAHETSQVEMLSALADSQGRVARSQDRERQMQMVRRTGRISDYLP